MKRWRRLALTGCAALALMCGILWPATHFVQFRAGGPIFNEYSCEIELRDGGIFLVLDRSDAYRFGEREWQYERLPNGSYGGTSLFLVYQTYLGQNMFRQVVWIPLWLATVAFALPPTLWLFLRYRNRHKRLPNHCHTCGYDLTGTLAAGRDECPECGAAVKKCKSVT